MTPATPATAELIRRNWLDVCRSVGEVATSANRDPTKIKIVGVSKYVDVALTRQLVDAGCVELGESRPQTLWEKHSALAELPQVKWHLIGHLQRNKLRRTLPIVDCLHSVDSWRLAEALQSEAAAIDKTLDILVEVNVTQDPSKTGLSATELPQLLELVASLTNLRVIGLMAMSSREAAGEKARREFEQVRQLRDTLQTRFGASLDLSQLSMGMSGDFREAIMEGATILRIGSILWEGAID